MKQTPHLKQQVKVNADKPTFQAENVNLHDHESSYMNEDCSQDKSFWPANHDQMLVNEGHSKDIEVKRTTHRKENTVT